jgi:hypothetical protein
MHTHTPLKTPSGSIVICEHIVSFGWGRSDKGHEARLRLASGEVVTDYWPTLEAAKRFGELARRDCCRETLPLGSQWFAVSEFASAQRSGDCGVRVSLACGEALTDYFASPGKRDNYLEAVHGAACGLLRTARIMIGDLGESQSTDGIGTVEAI